MRRKSRAERFVPGDLVLVEEATYDHLSGAIIGSHDKLGIYIGSCRECAPLGEGPCDNIEVSVSGLNRLFYSFTVRRLPGARSK